MCRSIEIRPLASAAHGEKNFGSGSLGRAPASTASRSLCVDLPNASCRAKSSAALRYARLLLGGYFPGNERNHYPPACAQVENRRALAAVRSRMSRCIDPRVRWARPSLRDSTSWTNCHRAIIRPKSNDRCLVSCTRALGINMGLPSCSWGYETARGREQPEPQRTCADCHVSSSSGAARLQRRVENDGRCQWICGRFVSGSTCPAVGTRQSLNCAHKGGGRTCGNARRPGTARASCWRVRRRNIGRSKSKMSERSTSVVEAGNSAIWS